MQRPPRCSSSRRIRHRANGSNGTTIITRRRERSINIGCAPNTVGGVDGPDDRHNATPRVLCLHRISFYSFRSEENALEKCACTAVHRIALHPSQHSRHRAVRPDGNGGGGGIPPEFSRGARKLETGRPTSDTKSPPKTCRSLFSTHGTVVLISRF